MKTRLIPKLGKKNVHELAEAFISDTLTVVNKAYWGKAVLATTGTVTLTSQYSVWVWRAAEIDRKDVEIWAQGSGDLGEKIERILRRCIEGYGGGIVLGSDSPGLPYHILTNARRALLEADAVLGPSFDGGFYLLGLKQCPEGLLSDLPWSAADTFDATKARLESQGLSVVVLEHFWDVDDPLDWEALWHRKNAGTLEAKATSEAMDSIGENFDINNKS